MNIKERKYEVKFTGTKNFQSVCLTEGITVSVDEKFDEFNWAAMKEDLKSRLIEETKKCLGNFTKERAMDDNIEISIDEK